ncbi:MAG: sensor histidine kinase [Actinobacteria bacterium]|nr:sensor histidine kinase [Actinomycetota bacterium]MBO0823690.1 sensor histidine kinase [Actinomycetota bacterium]
MLAVMAVAGGAVAGVTAGIPGSSRPLVGTFGGVMAVLLVAAAGWIAYHSEVLRRVRGRVEVLHRGLDLLAEDVLPAAAAKLRDGAEADSVLAAASLPADGALERVVLALAREIGAEERRRAAAMAACANAAGRVQALATSMLADLREMEDRHSEAVLGDLLRLDHGAAQAGRLADSIAVLTGARSGRRWAKPIVMESILRGAMGRIRAYQRIRIHSASTAAIAGYAAEDIMNALAELMDNATRFSPPSEEVHVYVEELYLGIMVTIEDAGLGMKPQALARAEAAVSASEPLDLAKLSGTRLGLAVVGCLARKHQLEVFFRPSSRGGTGVLVRIPNQLVSHPRDELLSPAPAPTMTAPPAGGDPAGSAGPAAAPTVVGGEQRSLPKRRPGGTLTAASRPAQVPRSKPPQPRTDSGARFKAFRQGARSDKRQSDPAPDRGSDPAGDRGSEQE